MWLKDFQRGLILLEKVKPLLGFDKEYCTNRCNFIVKHTTFCVLFNIPLKIYSENCRTCRCRECKEMFGE